MLQELKTVMSTKSTKETKKGKGFERLALPDPLQVSA
jgi:hypothetical protein